MEWISVAGFIIPRIAAFVTKGSMPANQTWGGNACHTSAQRRVWCMDYQHCGSVTFLVIQEREPACLQESSRVHSRYTRTTADLACGGRRVQLILHVRKFFCHHSECTRKIFTERLSPFLEPWARTTSRSRSDDRGAWLVEQCSSRGAAGSAYGDRDVAHKHLASDHELSNDAGRQGLKE